MKFGAVILAAGSGTRFGCDKLAIKLHGKPVWWHSYQAFKSHPDIAEVVLVCSDANMATVKEIIGEDAEVILGGDTRTASSLAGLWKTSQIGCDGILYHDAARPFVTAAVISSVAAEVRQGRAAAAAMPVVDTVKRGSDGKVVDHLDRSGLYAMQTPQGAPTAVFAEAFSKVQGVFTDDLELLSKAGFETFLVPGDARNFKITTSEDEARARAMMGTEHRTGLGYDIHRFSTEADRPCWLGGILFAGEIGLEGHSDADVILHAVVDALLGAASAGDIGQLFPNTDPANKNRPSSDFVIAAREVLQEKGWTLNHVDIAIQAEKPKIMPKAILIRERIASLLQIDSERVSVKATTNEGLGAIGRAEGICAFATASVSRT